MEFQISNDLNPSTYSSFSILFNQTHPEISVSIIQSYFNSKILCPPFKSTNALSFFNMISLGSEIKILKDFIQLLDYELNPIAYNKFSWRLKFSWTIPNGYLLKNPKANFGLFYTSSLYGFQKKDKYYFMVR
jgi:hypothetical protein